MHKPGNYSKIFNEQIPLILPRGKNLSKSSAQIHRAAMPNLKHLTSPQALHSKNESLASWVMCLNLEEEKNARIYVTEADRLSASRNLSAFGLNLCHRVCSWTWAKCEQQQQKKIHCVTYIIKHRVNYIVHLTWSTICPGLPVNPNSDPTVLYTKRSPWNSMIDFVGEKWGEISHSVGHNSDPYDAITRTTSTALLEHTKRCSPRPYLSSNRQTQICFLSVSVQDTSFFLSFF